MAVQMDMNTLTNVYGNAGTMQSSRPEENRSQPPVQAEPPAAVEPAATQPAVVATLSAQGLAASRDGGPVDQARPGNELQAQLQERLDTQTQLRTQENRPPVEPESAATAPSVAVSQPAIQPPANPEPQPQGMRAAQQSRIDKIV